ncbi:MAG TPA: type II toxin-antitoxin system VapC family toxin [Edaphobacter sp.]|uniref:type II toxin-antitoxin system VapC family toxin n=1 Tax=Edaphobacter sp. TaxID=1934404 RepID=UPI002BFD1CE5|nr:type II toxin-antitoxin system VapC family toxin [Edaphobacter sp.]HUZ95026.1 type II toxin-antitoxin system VapC family toxin [Edaphobacter sp.]
MILLDTHVAIWLAVEPSKISKRATDAISEARRTGGGLGIADVTLWEVAMLIDQGRIDVTIPMESFLKEIEANFIVFPVTSRIASRSMRFAAAYSKDPIDRLIGATAVIENFSLITRDEKIRASSEVTTVW